MPLNFGLFYSGSRKNAIPYPQRGTANDWELVETDSFDLLDKKED